MIRANTEGVSCCEPGEIGFRFVRPALLGARQSRFQSVFVPYPDQSAMLPDLIAENGAIFFNQPISCPGATDVGVEVDLFRSKAGWMLLFWDEAKNFTETNSISRFLPGGDVRTQFAFPNSGVGLYLRFDPLFQAQGEVQIKQILIYCLP